MAEAKFISSAESGDELGRSIVTPHLGKRDIIAAGAPGHGKAALFYCSAFAPCWRSRLTLSVSGQPNHSPRFGRSSMLPERKQILVVDDEPNLRRVLSAQLERDGYDVHTAEDGEQALLVLKEHHIDLVITDLRMPKLDGMELLRARCAIDDELPVVMITAHGTVDNAVEALKTGAFDYLTKPFDQAEVRAIVRKALRTRELAAAEAIAPGVRRARVGALRHHRPEPEHPRPLRGARSASPTRRPPCSSPARAAPARSSSRARCTRTRRDATSRSSRSTARRSRRI